MRKYLVRAAILLAVIFFTPLGGLFLRPLFTSTHHWFEGTDVSSFGSGFYVNARDVITNHHVIAGCGRILIGGRDGRLTGGRVIADDTTHDIAVVETQRQVAAVLFMGVNPLRPGDAAVYPDYTSDRGRFNLRRETVEKTGGGDVYLSLGLRSGNSGSPLLGSDGRVEGINKAIGGGRGALGFLMLSGYSIADGLASLSGFLTAHHVAFTPYPGASAALLKEPNYRDYLAVNIGCVSNRPWFMR